MRQKLHLSLFTHLSDIKNTRSPREKKFEGQMRILDKKRYFFDSLTEIAPYDFIGGWGDYSDEQNFRHVYVSILQRKPNIEISKSDISRRKITSNTVFFHAIPATPEIEGALSNMKVGHIARIKGVLVDVASENGLFYGTSLLSDSKPDTKAAMLFIEEVSFW